MFPGVNPKQMAQAMKKMGIKQEEVPANEVLIKCDDKIIRIENPSVTKVKMMGEETLQITGTMTEERIETAAEINEDDIKAVVNQTGVSEEKALTALKKNEGDIAKTILEITQNI